LPFTGQVGDPLYSSTREAVLTLKHPIRGIDTRQSIRWVRATSMMDRDDRYETEEETDQTGMIPDAYTDRQTDSCPVAQLTWAPAQMLPQGR
jgi:hypothetical protein